MSAIEPPEDGGDGAEALIDRVLALAPEERAWVIRGLPDYQQRELHRRWWLWAHPGQRAPAGDWPVWVIRAGRGFGKTRAGAEWVSQIARDIPGAQIALVGATLHDARRVMVEGVAGILSVARAEERKDLVWRETMGVVEFPSGAQARLFSAEAPETLRGPEHAAAWCDELGKWGARRGGAAWDNLLLTMRMGTLPRVLVTTTPRPTKLMRRVLAAPGTVETRGRTRENPALPESFVEAMVAQHAGTRWGRQELDGELVEDVVGALWTRGLVERCRVVAAAELVRVVVGVDPPASAEGDACGIVAVGLGRDAIGYVLEDASVAGLSPEGWAQAVAACAARWRAECVVAEKNQGGSMVESVLRAQDQGLPLRLVHAVRGKSARAEPIALLYEAGRVKHAGAFPALEDELCGLQAGGGYEGPGRSPDRADALVWALDELMLGTKAPPRIRGV